MNTSTIRHYSNHFAMPQLSPNQHSRQVPMTRVALLPPALLLTSGDASVTNGLSMGHRESCMVMNAAADEPVEIVV